MSNIKKILLIAVLSVLLFFFIYWLSRVFAGQFSLSSGFYVGFFNIKYYGLIQAIAVVIGYVLFSRIAQRVGLSAYIVERLIWYVLPAGYLGARLYFVVFNWSYYSADWTSILAVWQGGLAIHGGLIGGGFGIWLFARRNKFSFFSLTDVLVPAVALAQTIGRWGNFFNQEAFGIPTSLPWKMFVDEEYRPQQFLSFHFFHPTFLYESLWDALICLILWRLWKNPPKYKGKITMVYLLLYSFGRFFIEALRTDSLYIGEFKAAQVISVIGVVLSGGVLLIAKVTSYKLQVTNKSKI